VLTPTGGESTWAKIGGALAVRLNDVQARLQKPHANWVHIVFSKPGTSTPVARGKR
jgi:hypothetical protein